VWVSFQFVRDLSAMPEPAHGAVLIQKVGLLFQLVCASILEQLMTIHGFYRMFASIGALSNPRSMWLVAAFRERRRGVQPQRMSQKRHQC
jgi:hypothetical protein